MTGTITVMTNRTLTPDELDAIASAAVAHRRTVERRLLGLPVRGRVADRIDDELRRRGLIAADNNGPQAA